MSSPPKRKKDRVLPPAVHSSGKKKYPDLDKEFKRLKSLQPQIEAETRNRSRRGSGGSSSSFSLSSPSQSTERISSAAPTSPSRSSSAAPTSSPAADPVSSSEVHHSDAEPGHPSEDDLSDDLIDDLSDDLIDDLSDDLIDDLSDDHSEAHLSDRGPGQESEPAAAAIAGSSFSSDEMKVNKNSVLYTGRKTEGMDVKCMDINKYHARQSHQGIAGLRKLAKLTGTKLIGNLKHCDACARGKSKKTPAYRGQSLYRHRRGECWHGDLQGPFRTETRDRKRWALTFVEDYSGFCVTWMLAKKGDQFDCLASLIPWSMTQTGVRVKVIRADGDWISPNVVKELRKKWGFELKATHRNSSVENPLVERTGGILMERTRVLLFHASLPDSLIVKLTRPPPTPTILKLAVLEGSAMKISTNGRACGTICVCLVVSAMFTSRSPSRGRMVIQPPSSVMQVIGVDGGAC